MLEFFPEWLLVFIGSMTPWIEARYIIPYAIWEFNWYWWQAFPLALFGNLLPIPFVLILFKYIEKFLRRFVFWTKILDRLFDRTRKKADFKIKNYETIGLFMFVAIPLPFTGAWTGALIAYLFDLNFIKSLITIFIGLVAAATFMTFLTLTGVDIMIIILGIIILAIIMTIFAILGMRNEKN